MRVPTVPPLLTLRKRKGYVSKMQYLMMLSAAIVALPTIKDVLAFNAPPSVPTWCGKPYMNT
jgi:hypothetical protein